MEGPLRGTRGSVLGIQPPRGVNADDRSREEAAAAATRSRRGAPQDVVSERRADLLEQVHAERMRTSRAQARRASRPAPEQEPADSKRFNEKRALQSTLVTVLSLEKPPAEGRRKAAVAAREMSAARDADLRERVERDQHHGSAMRQRAVEAYRDAQEMTADGRLA